MVNSIDDRSSKKRPIAREVVELTLDFSEDDTTITGDIDINGDITDILLVIPDLNAGTQCTLSLEDGDGDEIYTSGLQTESATRHISPDIPVVGTTTVKIVTASAQIADRDFVAKIIYK